MKGNRPARRRWRPDELLHVIIPRVPQQIVHGRSYEDAGGLAYVFFVTGRGIWSPLLALCGVRITVRILLLILLKDRQQTMGG